MKYLIYVSLLVLISSNVRTIPKYIVDLNDMSTYTHVIAGKGRALRAYLKYNNQPLTELTGERKEIIDNMTPDSFVEKFGKLGNTLLYTAWYHNIPYKLLLANFLEVEWACFASIIEDPSGELWLLRNLDQGSSRVLQDLLVDIDFYENGKLAFSGIQAIGVGLLFNVTLKGEYTAVINLVGPGFDESSNTRILNGALFTSAILNLVIQNAKSFDEAISLIGNTKWSHSMLVIIAGKRPEEKAIIQIGKVNKIKATTEKILSIGNNTVDFKDLKVHSIKQSIRELENYSHVDLIKLIQQRPIWTSINTFSSVTNVSTGITYAEFSPSK